MNLVLTPASWLYGAVTWCRNKMFDLHWFQETSYDIPVIGVGNLTVGGTGKTPHVEYIVEALSSKYHTVVLSRGYKRKTKGFVAANSKSTPDQIGDEPLQIFNKYGHRVRVVVCENRRKGIERIKEIYPQTELIVLDDSFQHRWVHPKVSILLMDYNRPFYKDKIMPLGRLRESALQVNRADMVIVTKCPVDLTPINFRIVKKDLSLMPYQSLYFSRYEYGALRPVFPEECPYQPSLENLTADDAVLLLTGIAHPRYFVRHFRFYPFKVRVDHYPDHHDFTRKDIEEISAKFKSLKGLHKIIVTTEKDAVRLSHNPYFPHELKPFIYYIPVHVKMIDQFESKDFISELCAHIGTSSQSNSEF